MQNERRLQVTNEKVLLSAKDKLKYGILLMGKMELKIRPLLCPSWQRYMKLITTVEIILNNNPCNIF